MQVEEVMSRELVTVDPDATLEEAVRTMLERDVGSVVVLDAGPVGIVTEGDVLRALLAQDCSLSDLPVRAVMSGPVKSIAPSASVEHAADAFRAAGVKRLLVRNGLDVRGLVSVTDLAYHHRELYRDLVRTLDRGRNW